MAALCADVAARASKIESLLLRRLARPGTQAGIAAALGVSESAVSRTKTEHWPQVARILAHAGLKLVDADAVCMRADAYEFARAALARSLEDAEGGRRVLTWDD